MSRHDVVDISGDAPDLYEMISFESLMKSNGSEILIQRVLFRLWITESPPVLKLQSLKFKLVPFCCFWIGELNSLNSPNREIGSMYRLIIANVRNGNALINKKKCLLNTPFLFDQPF